MESLIESEIPCGTGMIGVWPFILKEGGGVEPLNIPSPLWGRE